MEYTLIRSIHSNYHDWGRVKMVFFFLNELSKSHVNIVIELISFENHNSHNSIIQLYTPFLNSFYLT